MWDKPLSIIFHQHFLHGKHFTPKVSLIAAYSVFGAEHGNLFCFGATAQLENKFSLGGHRKGAGYTMAWVTPWLWGQTQARTINKTKPECPSCLNSHGTCCSHRPPTWDRRASEWVTIALVSASLPPCTAWSYLTGRTTTENFFLAEGKTSEMLWNVFLALPSLRGGWNDLKTQVLSLSYLAPLFTRSLNLAGGDWNVSELEMPECLADSWLLWNCLRALALALVICQQGKTQVCQLFPRAQRSSLPSAWPQLVSGQIKSYISLMLPF